MRNRMPCIALLAAVWAGLPACDRGPGGEKVAGAAVAQRLRLGYFPNISHAQAVLGVASGDLERAIAPVKLETRVFNAGPSLIEALHAGEIDIGYIGPGPALNAHARSGGQGIRIVAGASADGVAIVARSESNIRGLQDLRGKRIATPQLGNTQDVAARHFVLSKLGQSDANNVIPVANGEQAAMMVRGGIDVAWAPEPWASRLIAEAGAVLVADERELWDGKHATLAVVIATPEFQRAQPELLRRVLSVHTAWTKRLAADPQANLAALGSALNALTGKSLPAEVFRAAVARTHFTNDPLIESLDKYAEWLFELGFVPQPIDTKSLVDISVLRSLE